MGIRKSPRFLAGVSAIAILGGVSACGEQTVDTGGSQPEAVDENRQEVIPGAEAADQNVEQVQEQEREEPIDYRRAGEGEGEGAGGDSGGEFGIDPEAAASDPVIYLSALEVMRAHYLAGMAAIEAGERAAGAEMFAHPISEIYIDLEPVLAERGVEPFMATLNEAAAAPYQGASTEEIQARIDDVLAAIDRAEAAAPAAEDEARVNALVLADLIERSALQYEFAVRDGSPEAYLDGFGFTATAQSWADEHMGEIEGEYGEFAETARTALSRLGEAFPAPTRPDEPPLAVDDVLIANETVQSAAGRL